jgi:hypothetical protein
MTPTEWWLPFGAAAFYLYDSGSLLWQNELMLTRGTRWRVSGGSELRLAGRRLFLPNPLLPHRPQLLLRWSLDESRTAGSDDPAALLQALRPVGVINLLQLFLLLLLPLLAWTLGAGLLLLLVFMLFYLLTLLALALIWRRRDSCRLSTRGFWLLALDVLACAPFAVNLVRRLSMRHRIGGDPLRFAARQLDAAGRADTQQIIAARLAEEYAGAGESVERDQRSAVLLAKLAG